VAGRQSRARELTMGELGRRRSKAQALLHECPYGAVARVPVAPPGCPAS